MQVHPSRARYALCFALTLLASLALSGCGGGQQQLTGTFKCSDQTVTVDWSQKHGVNPHQNAIYLCTGNKVTWNPAGNVQSFTITFQDSPFGPSPQTFDQNHNVSPPMPAYTDSDWRVFKYSLQVTDTQGNSHPFDPHVIGGGGLS